ncbi:MAG: farnesyl diphosphate synthase [Pseudomonadota bacterium]
MVGTYLDHTLPKAPDVAVMAAMHHGSKGGKRLRGFLVLESADLFGISAVAALPSAGAIEAIHAYSLIHDDLPCMDDDDLRRGEPTIHVKWDEATAVLAGDALQSYAFGLLAKEDCHPDPEIRVRLIAGLAAAAGAEGMVLGQALDMAAETATRALTLDEISALQAHKTGALISWSAQAGAILADMDPGPLARYADALGLAFQIADDILDVEGDETATGKRVGKDDAAGKATFVSLLGLDGAKAKAADLVAEAEASLGPYGNRAQILRDAARYVIDRDR